MDTAHTYLLAVVVWNVEWCHRRSHSDRPKEENNTREERLKQNWNGNIKKFDHTLLNSQMLAKSRWAIKIIDNALII